MKTLHFSILGISIIFVLTFSFLESFELGHGSIARSSNFGLTETFPSPNIGNRTIEISFKMYSNSSDSNNHIHYMQFRIFDVNTNQTIHHVSLFLNFSKNNELLMQDLFHTHTGLLTLQINSTGTTFTGIMHANNEPILNGWVPYADNEPITVNAPILNDVNSTYVLNVQVYSIDKDNSIFDSSIAPKFNSYLSIKEQNMTKTMIPEWIEYSAKWWSEGNAGDSSFIQVLDYLINNEMKTMFPNESAVEFIHPSLIHATTIPSWIKNDAGWWADGKISDMDFANAMHYLLEKGIIRL